MKRFVGLIAFVLIFPGCIRDSAESVGPKVWYDVYGNVCSSSPSAGCNYYSDGKKITYIRDPYYWSEWKESNPYYDPMGCEDHSSAFCDPWNSEIDVNPEKYYSNFQYFDLAGNAHFYSGLGWMSPSGIFYDHSGNALNTPDSDLAMDRDIIAAVAAQEEQIMYALAEDVGIRVARVVNDWSRLGMKRARTDADVGDFMTRLYGVEFKKVAVSFDKAKNGDRAEFASVLEDMAHAWGTSPETAHVILVKSYGSILREYGLE